MNEIIAISDVHAYLDAEGTVWLNAEDVARGLGFTKTEEKFSTTNGRNEIYESIRWARVNDYLAEFGYSHKVGKEDFIPENMFYRLAMKAKNEAAEKFQDWVYHEVLPSIRKTGVYSNDKAYQKWLETREHSKCSRKQETSAIKVFIEYAQSQGCTWEDWYFYSTISIWANIGAGLPQKNGRDNATVHQLNIIDLLEGTVIRKVLIDGIANGLHYTQIWAKTQQQIDMFLKITFQEPKLLTA